MFPGTNLDSACLLSKAGKKGCCLCGYCYHVKLWLPSRTLRLLGYGGNDLYLLCFVFTSFWNWGLITLVNFEYHRSKQKQKTSEVHRG